MQTIILAGGRGTRLSEETATRPKPMVEVGGYPILWHIMNIYATQGFKDFLVACGYRGQMIKQYFHDFGRHSSDYFVDLKSGTREILNECEYDWRVGLIDTGLDTMTGGRILRLKSSLQGERFMLTYGDAVANIDIHALLAFHESHGKLATVTAVRPPARFGVLGLDGDRVSEFSEKPQTGEGWINGGYFVFEPRLLDYIADDSTILEYDVLEQLTTEGELMAYRHGGFWRPMDTLRDKHLLESLWTSGEAPWKLWA